MAATHGAVEVELTVVPRGSVRFPLPMPVPDGFDHTKPETVLGNETRGADVAIWTAAPSTAGFERRPPILAVEVTDKDEEVDDLAEKADWYLAHGVSIVWIVDPDTRAVIVVTNAGRTTAAERLPESPLLPGLAPLVADFFRQL